jgi:RimJ/RimL family protein N-acetyltransferase
LTRLLAITTQDNRTSQRLLAKLGFESDREITMPNDTEVLRLFSMNLG